MRQAETFREDLEALLALAAASDFRLSRAQVEGAFENYTLSDEQMEMVYQYLNKNYITVEENDKTQATKNRDRQVRPAAGSGPDQVSTSEEDEESEEDSAYYKMYMEMPNKPCFEAVSN